MNKTILALVVAGTLVGGTNASFAATKAPTAKPTAKPSVKVAPARTVSARNITI